MPEAEGAGEVGEVAVVAAEEAVKAEEVEAEAAAEGSGQEEAAAQGQEEEEEEEESGPGQERAPGAARAGEPRSASC